MPHEVVSALTSKGLFAGTSGFCPVAVTTEMPRELVQVLADIAKRQYEKWTGGSLFSSHMYYHFPLTLNQQPRHLVGRGFLSNGTDGSRQKKCVIHQLLLENVKSIPAGPAWLLANDSIWISEWNLDPQSLQPREIERKMLSPRICQSWSQVTGDAGWAGAALEAWQKSKAFTFIVPPTLDSHAVIDMFVEAQSLIEPRIRWNIPMAVSAWSPSKLQNRMWSAVLSGSKASVELTRNPANVVVDITRKLEPAANTFSEIARAGAWARMDSPGSQIATKQPSQSAGEIRSANQLFAGIEDPLLAALPSATESSKRTLVSSAQPKRQNVWGRRLRSFHWVKFSVATVLLGLIAFGLWKGSQFAGYLTTTINNLTTAGTTTSATLPPKTTQLDPALDAAPPPLASEEPVKPVASNMPGPAEAKLSFAESKVLLKKLRENNPFVLMPDPGSSTPIRLMTIPTTKVAMSGFGIGLATLRQFVELTEQSSFDPDGGCYSVDVADALGNKAATIGFGVESQSSENGPLCELNWAWQTSPTKDVSREIQAGVLLIWSHADPTMFTPVPLEGPHSGPAFNLIDSLVDGVIFAPQAVFSPETSDAAGVVKWSAQVTDFAARTDEAQVEKTGVIWLSPQSAGNTTNHFVLNNKYFEEQLQAAASEKAGKSPEIQPAITALIDQASPIEIEIRLDDPRPIEEGSDKMVATIRMIVFLKGADGGRNSIILQRNPQLPKKPGPKELEKQIKADFANWLASSLDVPLNGAQILGNGYDKQFQSLRRWEDRVKAMFAQHLFEAVSDLLEGDFAFEAAREMTLHAKSGKINVDILAYEGK